MLMKSEKDKIKDPTFYILVIGGECFFLISLICIFLFSRYDYGSSKYLFAECLMNIAEREIVITLLVGLISYILNSRND